MSGTIRRIGKGQLAESNAQPARQVRAILEGLGLGLEIATPAEAREILQLKGVANVAFWTAGSP